MYLRASRHNRLVAASTGFCLLLGCTVSAGGPSIIGGNEQGGIVDGVGRGVGVEEMGVGSKKAFELAEAHCIKYGRSAVVSPWSGGQMAFTCVKPGA